MKPSLVRRYRRRSTASRSEGAFFKKESQQEHSFFGETSHDMFFQPAVAPAQSIQRKCENCEEEKKVQRAEDKKEEDKKVMKKEDKKEEEKVMKKEEKKEEEKVHRAADKKEEEKVMKMEDKKEEEKVHKKEAGAASTPGKGVSNYISSLNGKGNPLSAQSNHFFSSKMGYDFSGVKVHTDKEAAESAKGINAKAYTIGNNVVFNEGQYNTESTEGKKLIAHELVHVAQQNIKGPNSVQRWSFYVPKIPMPKWTNDQIRHVQRGLRERGVYNGETSGIIDEQTKKGLDTWFGSNSWQGLSYGNAMKSLKFSDGGTKPGKGDCPKLTPGETERSNKREPELSEKTPGKEWILSGFPIGQSNLNKGTVDSFIDYLLHLLFKSGRRMVQFGLMDKLIVKGYTDCFGDKTARTSIKSRRASFISAALNEQVNDKSNLSEAITSSDAEYLGPNESENDRAANRSVLISKELPKPVTYPGGYPYDPNYKPTRGNCLPYYAGDSYFGKTYPANAYDACTVTPDDPNNNCVRKCLQEKYFDFIIDFGPDLLGRKTIVPWCPSIWKHHVDCYKVCGCENGFIDYLGFYPLCDYRSSATISSIGINVFNRCNKAK